MKSTISIYNFKGGAGKTTTAVTLARLWAEEKPLLCDLDGQQSTHRYTEVLKSHGVRMEDIRADDFYGKGLPDSSLTIIDCPPDIDVATPALEVSSVILVPFCADGDVWDNTKVAWERIKGIRHHAEVIAVMTLYKPASPIDRETLAEARSLMGPQLSRIIIRSREIMRAAHHKRLTILDTAPDSPAAKQIKALGAEIVALRL